MATNDHVSAVIDQASDESVRRLIKDTSLYDTAIGLYPVLLGLILTDSLKNMAQDIVDHPLNGDWSLRFLTLALLLFSALWLHVWIATFRGMTVTGSGTPHEKYPGYKINSTEGYSMAIGVFWLGVIQLLIFACMAYSLENHQKEFYIESAVYSLILFAYTALGVNNRKIENETKRKVWRDPRDSIKSLWSGRHIPLSDEQLTQQIEGDNQDLQILRAQGRLYDTTLALVLIAISFLLYALTSKFGQAWWISLLALIATSIAVVTDYYVYPYFYLL